MYCKVLDKTLFLILIENNPFPSSFDFNKWNIYSFMKKCIHEAAGPASLTSDPVERRLKELEERFERMEKKHEKEMKTMNERVQQLVSPFIFCFLVLL